MTCKVSRDLAGPEWLLQPVLQHSRTQYYAPTCQTTCSSLNILVHLILLVYTFPLSRTPALSFFNSLIPMQSLRLGKNITSFKNPYLTTSPKKDGFSRCSLLHTFPVLLAYSGGGKETSKAFCPGCWRGPWQCPYLEVFENRQCWENMGVWGQTVRDCRGGQETRKRHSSSVQVGHGLERPMNISGQQTTYFVEVLRWAISPIDICSTYPCRIQNRNKNGKKFSTEW